MKKSEPVFLVELFPVLNARLVELLGSLSPEEWHTPTICRLWNVKDIAAHLLDGNLRRLSMHRDGYFSPDVPAINSPQELLGYLNQLNADWVKAAKRLSPGVITDMLASSGEGVYQLFKSLDPFGEALFPVAWAGEHASRHWFDIGREYTERWLHQQQIRLAVDKPALLTKELYYPFLDIFMRALPYTYREMDAPEDTLLQFTVTGEGGGTWFLRRENGLWELYNNATGTPDVEVMLDEQVAWKVFSKGMTPQAAAAQTTIKGNHQLGSRILEMVSVMA